jgi:hypothetical protein
VHRFGLGEFDLDKIPIWSDSEVAGNHDEF